MTIQNYLSYFDEMMRPTEPLFRAVPGDKLDWKPVEHSFTLGQQMAHMAGALSVYANGITRGDWGFVSLRERFVQNRHTPSLSVEEAVQLLHEGIAEFRKEVGSLTEDEFNAGAVQCPQLGGPFPRWRIAMLAVEHHLNHKAELFMSLKVLGISLNTRHLYVG